MLYYQGVISKRHYADYLMLLMIQHNPHQDNPQELFDQFQMETGTSYIDQVDVDKPAMQNLQSLISPNMQK